MSDEIDQDLLKELGDLGGDGTGGALDPSLDPALLDPASEDLGGSRTATAPSRSGGRSRIAGLLALVLGIVGSLLMVVLAVLSIRMGFRASGTVDRAMEPVEVAFDRMEARIDEADDLVNRVGTDPDGVDELQARVDSLVDVTTGADQVFASVESHPLYRLLPAELSPLGDALGDFTDSANNVDELLGDTSNGTLLTPAVVDGVADQVDGMQSRVTSARTLLLDAATSLRRWIRIGSFLGFLGSLWGLWAQIQLARRGWRGSRGRDL
jgi:hypothetical protein